MVALFDLELEQFDVKTYFLHGGLGRTNLYELSKGFHDSRMKKTTFAYCENLAPFLKPKAKTPKLVLSDFGFGLEIKLVVCLK
jgi:hypothetical protein